MSEETKDPLELETAKEPEAKPVKQDKTKEGEASQEELDWRAKLSDDLKSSKSLAKFKTVENLASSYIHLENKSGKWAELSSKDQKNTATQADTLKTIYGDQEYSEDLPKAFTESVKGYNLPAELAESLYKTYEEKNKEFQEKQREAKIQELKANLKNRPTIEDDNRFFTRGLKVAGLEVSNYKAIFGDAGLNEKIFETFVKIGRDSMSDKHIAMEQGKTGGLPSDWDTLRADLRNLHSAKHQATDGLKQREIQKQIDDIVVKMNKVKKPSDRPVYG